MNKFDPTSHNITDEQRAHLKESFPEAFTEQGIDFDRLKTLLGEAVEIGPERYSFTWPGKTEAIRAAQASSMGTLAPDKASSVDWDTTENLYLEGDNLEILKLLQKSYTGKVKMIYIDPPYNTGKDFVYPDKYGEGLKTYLEYTGQVDGEGKKLTTNTETDGRYHSKWLNMMYPRLMLARNLLKDDGIIFVSIDDNEAHNLVRILDEIFGEENFIDNIIWKKRYGGGAKEKYFVTLHEYIYVYAKNIENIPEINIPLTEESIERYYILKDSAFEKRGSFRTHPLEATKSMEDRPNLIFPISGPDGSSISPKRQWLWSRDRVADAIANDELYFVKSNEGTWGVHTKQYLRDRDGEMRVGKMQSIIEDVFTQHGTNEIIDLFNNAQIFSFPKPTNLIKKLLLAATNVNASDIVVDFFSGSSASAHAVMALNAEDGGNRRFVMTQLQEPTPEDSEARKAGYANIADIGKERIHRAGTKIRKESAEKIINREIPLDTGFKTYRLSRSTFNVWDVKNEDDLQQKLVEATSLIKGNAKEEDVLTELILKSGYGLTEKVEEITIGGKKLFSVAGGQLIISLGSGLTLDQVRQIAEKKPMQFVAREHGFAGDDVLTNTAQIMKDKGIDFRVL